MQPAPSLVKARPAPCITKDSLGSDASKTLALMCEIIHEILRAIRSSDHTRVRDLETRLQAENRWKTRLLEELNQHCAEHGC
jgi:hypothetical protein